MLEVAVLALIVSLVAGALGFGGLARGAAAVAKIVFAVFLIAAAVLFLMFWAGIRLIT